MSGEDVTLAEDRNVGQLWLHKEAAEELVGMIWGRQIGLPLEAGAVVAEDAVVSYGTEIVLALGALRGKGFVNAVGLVFAFAIGVRFRYERASGAL